MYNRTMQKKKVSFNIEGESLARLQELAVRLNSTPGKVISQALSLLLLAQGRRVIFKRSDTNHYWETIKYENQPIASGTASTTK